MSAPIVRLSHISIAGSTQTYQLVHEWIEECSAKHNFCQELTRRSRLYPPEQRLPRRILQIEPRDDNYKIILLEGIDDDARYVALSHCWGKHQPLTTTAKTSPLWKAGIPFEKLPLTFQHAIKISASLGFKYLWIDSLCILQDDKEDWARESVKMGAIYESAWLTIAAAAAPDGTYGCFPSVEKPIEYQLSTLDESSQLMTVYSRKVHSPTDARDNLLKVNNTLPLFQRAWVIQERLLARRILYLFEDEMAFECATNARCECSGPSTDEVMQRYQGIEYAGFKYKFHGLLNQWYSHRNFKEILLFKPTGILEVWDHMVNQYTRRQLTFDSDRLPALAGVARKVYETGALGRYFAGLWEGRFAECLLWYVSVTTPQLCPLPPDNHPSTAPSWSWASVKGSWDYRRPPSNPSALYVKEGQEMNLTERFPQCTEFGMELNLSNSDPFSAVKSGQLTFKARTTEAVIIFERSDPVDDYALRFKQQRARLEKNELMVEAYMDFVLDYGQNPVLSGTFLKCVAILREFDHWEGLSEKYHGLVLAANGGDKFKRIGKFLAPMEWFEGATVEKIVII